MLLIIETIVKTDVTINSYCSYILSIAAMNSYCSYSSFHSLSPILSRHIFLTPSIFIMPEQIFTNNSFDS